MSFTDILVNRRSVRNFKQMMVSYDLIEKIIHESCYAPSSGNEQPWKFTVVQEKSLMDEISLEAKKHFLLV